MLKVGILGATGYAGAELVRLLLGHPKVKIVALGSVSHKGQTLEEIYPGFGDCISIPLMDTQQVIAESELIFISLPHGFSEEIAATALALGKRVVDLGADFRLSDEKEYQQWYQRSFSKPHIHSNAVYGLPEFFRNSIENKKLIANPGCYPTAAALALVPLVAHFEIFSGSIVVDAKSGATGAGKSLSDTTHFPFLNENTLPYSVAQHRHTPEIEQTIDKCTGKSEKITFTPHLIPTNRGILSTCYASLTKPTTVEKLHTVYAECYQGETFVRVLPLGKSASLQQVVYSNYCNLSVHYDQRTNKAIVVSALDNMIKGAAGQAIQNMNLMYGFSETEGLRLISPAR